MGLGLWLGGGLALAAAGSVVIGPPSVITIGLAVAAVVALAGSPRIGPLAAPLAVILTLPFGRAADVGGLQLAGIPVRAHDAVLLCAAVAVIVSARGLRRPADWRAIAAFGLFLVVGALATGIAVANGDQELRGVLRDVRWWALYAFGAALLVLPARRATLVRALLLGGTLFSAVIVVAALLPAFPGGLKEQALRYDGGLLRMQFNNSTLLLPAAAWVTASLVRGHRARASYASWLGLLLAALALSLTRMLLGVAAVMLPVVAVWAWRAHRRRAHTLPRTAAERRRLPRPLLAGMLALAAAGVALAAVPGTRDAIVRVVAERADFSGVSGRFYTYGAAWSLVSQEPVVGHGMGQLVRVPFANDQRAHVAGMQPGVDNALLTIGMKAGLLGMVAFMVLALAPLAGAGRRGLRRLRPWYVPSWLGLLALTATQSYATSSYGPFVLGAVIALPFLGRRWYRRA